MARRTRDAEAELNLPPGFRFHPTDEELIIHYLCRKVAHHRLPVPIIAEVDLYKYDPWHLPEKALFGQREWYFFTPRDRKYPNGSRPNRAAGRGYWKATGADKPVTPTGCPRPLGIKKALVFYSGKAPKGVKTDWIMHEYRLAATDRTASKKGSSLRLDDWVLCRLYNKKNSWEKTQQRQKEESMGSYVDDAGSESFRTMESDIESDVFPEFEDLTKPGAYLSQLPSDGMQAVRTGFQAVEQQQQQQQQQQQRQKDDREWFMDLNLDDLQGTFLNFGSTTTPAFDLSSQEDYFFQANMGSAQNNLPPF